MEEKEEEYSKINFKKDVEKLKISQNDNNLPVDEEETIEFIIEIE